LCRGAGETNDAWGRGCGVSKSNFNGSIKRVTVFTPQHARMLF